MKGKQLLILLILAALAVGGWRYFLQRQGSTWSASDSGSGGKVIEFPLNDVAHVKIKGSAGELNLVKKGDGWVVQERADYPANFAQVSGLLRTLWELKTVQVVKVGPSQMSRLELVEPGHGDSAGTLIECLGADGQSLAAFLVGKKYAPKVAGDNPADFGNMTRGRYVKPLSGDKVSLVSDALDDADPKPARWLDKGFVKVEGASSVAVTGASPASTWTMTRENATADWKLADAKPDETVDKNKTFPLNNLFSAASFDDVLAPDAKPAETGLDKPTTAVIDTFDGFHYEIKIGQASGENYPVQIAASAHLPAERPAVKDEKPEDKTKHDEEFKTHLKQLQEKLAGEQKLAGHTFLVPKFTVEPLLKERTAYLAEKPPEAKPAAGTSAAPTPTPPAAPATPSIEATTPPVGPPATPTPATPAPAAPAPTPATPAPAPQVSPATPPPVSPEPEKPAENPPPKP